MKNSFLNMVLALGGVTLVCGAGVSLVYSLTEEPRRLAREADVRTGMMEVLPEFDGMDSKTFRVDGGEVVVHTAERGGRTVGYAVETFTNRGFSGEIRMIVGFTPDAGVADVKVLEHAETPGFGDKITEPDNPLLMSIRGRRLSDMRLAVRRDGGDIDALTGATVTSRAYVDAVARAYNALMMMRGEDSAIPADAASGATEPRTDAVTGATEPAGETTGATATDAATGATEPAADTVENIKSEPR